MWIHAANSRNIWLCAFVMKSHGLEKGLENSVRWPIEVKLSQCFGGAETAEKSNLSVDPALGYSKVYPNF